MSNVSTNYNKNTELFESSYTVVGIKSLSKYIHQSLIRPAHNVCFFLPILQILKMEIFLPCFYFLFFCFPRSHNRFQILFQFLVNYRVLFLHLVLILYLVLANYNNRAPQHYTPTTSQNCGYKTRWMHMDGSMLQAIYSSICVVFRDAVLHILVVQISLSSTSQGCCCSAVFLIFYHQVAVYKPKVLFGFALYLQKKNTKSNSSKSVYIFKKPQLIC